MVDDVITGKIDMGHMKSMNGKNIKCLEDKSLSMYFIEYTAEIELKLRLDKKG